MPVLDIEKAEEEIRRLRGGLPKWFQTASSFTSYKDGRVYGIKGSKRKLVPEQQRDHARQIVLLEKGLEKAIKEGRNARSPEVSVKPVAGKPADKPGKPGKSSKDELKILAEGEDEDEELRKVASLALEEREAYDREAKLDKLKDGRVRDAQDRAARDPLKLYHFLQVVDPESRLLKEIAYHAKEEGLSHEQICKTAVEWFDQTFEEAKAAQGVTYREWGNHVVSTFLEQLRITPVKGKWSKIPIDPHCSVCKEGYEYYREGPHEGRISCPNGCLDRGWWTCSACGEVGSGKQVMLYDPEKTAFVCRKCGLERKAKTPLKPLGTRRSKLSSIQGEIRKASNSLQELDKAYQERYKAFNQAQWAWTTEIQNLAVECDNLEQTIKAEKERLEKDVLQPILEKVREKDVRLGELAKLVPQREAEYKSVAAKRDSAQTELDSLQGRCLSLRNEVSSLDAKRECLAKECDSLGFSKDLSLYIHSLLDECIPAGLETGSERKDLDLVRQLAGRVKEKLEGGEKLAEWLVDSRGVDVFADVFSDVGVM